MTVSPDDVADVVVVGAGASGAVAAWALSRLGLKVVCLEQGTWVPPETYPHWKPDWELHRQTDFAKDPNVRRRPEDYPIDTTDSPINPLMFNAVGGSTIHWTGHFPRFRPSDFRVRSLDGVADDWPISYWDLEPYYERNDAFIGVSGLDGDPGYPPRAPRHEQPSTGAAGAQGVRGRSGGPPQGLGAAGEAYVRGLEQLGWHWWPSDSALLTTPHQPGRAVCTSCGPCDMGCPIGALSSAQVTYWPAALEAGVDLRTHARVREITVDARGRADAVVYYDADGQIQEQPGRAVIVACNGVGTPRLLLNSVSGRFPNGLANSSGMVGRNLMFHPFACVSGVFHERVDGYKGPLGSFLYSHEFYETDAARGFVRGVQLQLNRDTGPLTAALGGFTGHPVAWGAEHHRQVRARYGKMLNVGVLVDDLPEAHNTVTLSPTLRDGHGIPAPKITYTLSENSAKALEFGIARSAELLEACGAHTILVDRLVRDSGWHLMGTARMGDDPAKSVVDRWGRAHDVPNLFVVDASVFVTGAAVNPTTTIQALALRTSEWLGEHWAEVVGEGAPA